MSAEHVRSICSEARMTGTAVLEGYRFLINRRGWATVVSDPERRVHGVLWQVGQECVRSLDEFEGIEEGLYRREQASVCAAGATILAEIYIADDSTPGMPSRGYLDAIIDAARAARFSDRYISELAQWYRVR